jgi:hypothetical protein
MENIRVYRFRDSVTLSVNGSDVYLTRSEAWAMAEALMACKSDIEFTKFASSPLAVTELSVSGELLRIDRTLS